MGLRDLRGKLECYALIVLKPVPVFRDLFIFLISGLGLSLYFFVSVKYQVHYLDICQ
jgi:hypothetical protein